MVTMDSLTKAAALAGALPGLTVTITGAAGGRIVVGPSSPRRHACVWIENAPGFVV